MQVIMNVEDRLVEPVDLSEQANQMESAVVDSQVLSPILESDPDPDLAPKPEPISEDQLTEISGLASLADMPLHEWVAALTHPITGQYPNGITTRMMDSLVRQMGVTQFPGPDRRRYHNVWKTISHFAVYLSEAARKGRIRRVSLGTYKGVFGEQASLQAFQTPLVPSLSARTASNKFLDIIGQIGQKPTVIRSSSKRKSFCPQRHPVPDSSPKRVCITGPSPVTGSGELIQNGNSKIGNERPPSCDSINGGSGSSSTDDCPIGQHRGTMVIRRRGQTLEVIRTDAELGTSVSQIANKAKMPDKGGDVPKPSVGGGHLCLSQIYSGPKHCQNSDIDEFGLPSLLKVEPSLKTATIESLAALSIADVAGICEKIGFDEGAKALMREEVDGTALLLLSREDITHNLGLKLGPALKLHRLVRTLQICAKNSQRPECGGL